MINKKHKQYKLKNKNFMNPFKGWGSTASRLEPFQCFKGPGTL